MMRLACFLFFVLCLGGCVSMSERDEPSGRQEMGALINLKLAKPEPLDDRGHLLVERFIGAEGKAAVLVPVVGPGGQYISYQACPASKQTHCRAGFLSGLENSLLIPWSRERLVISYSVCERWHSEFFKERCGKFKQQYYRPQGVLGHLMKSLKEYDHLTEQVRSEAFSAFTGNPVQGYTPLIQTFVDN